MSETHAPEQKIAPKSLLRHRPIEEQRNATGKTQEQSFVPSIQRTSRLSNQTEHEKVPTWKHSPSDSTRQQRSAPPSSSPISPSRHSRAYISPAPITRKPRTTQRFYTPLSQFHPLLLLGLAMMLMLLVWMLLSIVLSWASMTLDTLHYGYPRTYQIDMYVGHHEHPGQPSHFMVLNLHRHIEIIEIEGSDPAHTRIYSGPQLYGSQDDLTPATLSFVTQPGKKYPDMILHVGNAQLTYTNTGQTFVSPLSSAT